MKLRLFLLLLFGLLLAVTACRPATLATPIGQSVPEQRYPLEVDPVGLDRLDSYRANLVATFDGTRGGEVSAGQIESLTEVNRPMAAVHQYLKVAASIPDDDHPLGVSRFFQIGRQLYISQRGETFRVESAPPVSPGAAGFLEPERLMILPQTVAQPPQVETLNGLNLLKYSFTQADLDSPALHFHQAQGQVWLHPVEHYVVQYVISASVTMPAPIPNAHILDEGRLELRYSLVDINGDVTITLPDDAPTTITPLAQIPPPPNSAITAIFPAYIEYTSTISPISATLFYQQGLPTQGWLEDNIEVFEEKARLTFTKDEQVLTLIITPTGKDDTIKIVLDMAR